MTPIGLFYGSNGGFTALVSRMIAAEFDTVAPELVTMHDIAEVPLDRLLDYDCLIIGCPTWNHGQLQDDWDDLYVDLDDLDFTGKKVAVFGLGDQYGYGDFFCDAIGILGRKFAAQGAELLGFTLAAGYEFDHSRGVEDGRFMGLALDEDNESDLTPDRITAWIWQLVDEFDLVRFLEPAA
jgi:flavodoxin I